MKAYLSEKWKQLLKGAAIVILINVYFGYICGTRIYLPDLLYLDILCLALGMIWFIGDYHKYRRIQKLSGEQLQKYDNELESLIGRQAFQIIRSQEEFKNKEIRVLNEEIMELTDYITKWAHEAKLPLSALRLMNERNSDVKLQEEMKECLERIQQLINTMMMGSKLKNMENDMKIEPVSLDEVVKKSLKNQSYFLIRDKFQIEIELDGGSVYSDKRWLSYLMDQLVGNSIKYKSSNPVLKFGFRKISSVEVLFYIEDNGIGIPAEEIPYVFDKSYIGGNLREGDYRSTGMGLYFVKKAADRLGIRIQVQGETGKGTRFELYFKNITDFLIL